MNKKVLEAAPVYIAGGFFSQARNLQSLTTSERQNACYIATISSFIKKHGAACFAAPVTLISTFNTHCPKFGLNIIGRSTFFTIQRRVLDSGLVTVDANYLHHQARSIRKFSLNIELLISTFSAVARTAISRAKAYLQRQLDSHRHSALSQDGTSNDAASDSDPTHRNWTIRSKGSKDLKNKYKTPDGAFYKNRFREDCDTAYQLQNSARNGAITAAGAKKLIQLHEKHGVFMATTFRNFLVYVIVKTSSDARRTASIRRMRQREARQYGGMPIELPLPSYLQDQAARSAGEVMRRKARSRILLKEKQSE
ncbi:hypothetical protein L4174_023690 (plasmid) [Photobacterium sp. CCB-ST2H9]|uniref:hypothetical protein n=1 Tax=Photobacterium sp. CCB-ST2H9 TaxID=2912855 RepID=UPI0020067690|nr:hypothetical protein [Photobacterium sp. CCB-ST2H9]UTM60472.1 hypothetical protein L4174_023690 [Photobacterium sp. CCB-ST2H9]